MGQVGGFLWFPQPIKRTATIYNWNNVESGVKHYKPTKPDVYHKLNIEVDFCSTTFIRSILSVTCYMLVNLSSISSTNKTDYHDIVDSSIKHS